MRSLLFSIFMLLVSFSTNAATGIFEILDLSGSQIGSDNTVTASIVYPGSGSSIASPTPFLGTPWTTHDITTYQNGTYTITTSGGNSYTFTVGTGQIGAHILFDWGVNTNVDVIEVWDVTDSTGTLIYSPFDWDGDGIPGGAMVEGPFPGLTINFTLTGSDLPLVNNVPTITLNGSSSLNIQTGSTYIDSGATATDAEDGDLTASIITNNTVDTSVSGTYTVTYSSTDSDGNTSIATRIINVITGAFPVITLNGVSPINVYIYDIYEDALATANDAEDGDLTAQITFNSNVDTSVAGSYSIDYSVTDSAGNTSSISRTVNVITGDIPIISLLGNTVETISLGDTYIDAGATASDTEDGDLTSNIVINSSVDTSIIGSYSISYNVVDSQQNVAAEVIRTVNVVDPGIASGVLQIYDVDGTSLFYDDAITASITYPGSGSSISTPTLFFNTPFFIHDVTTFQNGTHSIDTVEGGFYNFTVGAGQIGVHMLIDWSANTNIDIVVVWDITTSTNAVNYTSTDWDGDGIPGAAMIDGPFPGMSFSLDLLGSTLPPASNIPSITLNGASTINLQTGANYIDAGATAADTEDGDLTASIITSNNVDTSIAGTYTVNYSVTDSDANTVVATRTVIVTQGNFPVITLNGDSPTTTYINEAYIDAGATVYDAEDGDITSSLVISNTVDTNTAGSYTVTYSVTDADANTSIAVRTVNVITGDAPVLSLLGNPVVSISIGSSYNDAGATANDTEDGDLTANIVINNPVNTSIAGTYTLTYNVTDSNGNAANAITRTVEVFDPSIVGGAFTLYDTTGAEIFLDTAISASIVYPGSGSVISTPTQFLGTPFFFHGITTYQNGTHTVTTSDGGSYTFTVGLNQIGAHILIDWGVNANISAVNVWDVSETAGVVSYTSTDWDNDGILGGAMIDGPFPGLSFNLDLSGSSLPPVNNVPVLTLNGAPTINLQVGTTYIDSGATAQDAEDGDLTANISITNPVDTSIAGVYTINYSVTDSDANTATTTRTVIVTQGTFPVITLNGTSPVLAYIGEAYLDAGATASDAEDGDISASLTVNSNVDTSIAGTYTVTYSVTDADSNTSTSVRYVKVISGDIPVITLVGNASINVALGSLYVDEGAIANDTEDGDLTSSIVVNNTVDTSTIGSYTVTYNVTDSNGNSANQITRLVSVQALGNAEMCVLDTIGSIIGCDASVQASILFPGSGSTISTPTPFFQSIWVAHDITTFLEGSYSIDTIEGGVYNFSVGTGQIAAHILLDWSTNTNIDVVVVWNVTEELDGTLTLNATDWDNDGIPGAVMIDGPFAGNSIYFDIRSVMTTLPVGNTPPVISMNDAATLIIYQGETFTDPGATAYDNEDGDLTYEILVTGNVDTSITGTYSVIYSVTDYDGYEVSSIRTVKVVEADADADGILYLNDNCVDVANADQRDTDSDGFGNICDGDLNNDNIINAIDLGLFKQKFFTSDADADLNGDGIVNALDLGIFKQMYGQRPGPSGLL